MASTDTTLTTSSSYHEEVIQHAAEIIPGKLYFTSLSLHPEGDGTTRYLTADTDLVYCPFFADFGPLNLCMLTKFCRALHQQVEGTGPGQRIVFYSLHDGHKRANAGYLICCYAVLCLKKSPQEAWRPLQRMYPPFLPFRDASYGISTHNLTIVDCVAALQKAIWLGWYDVNTFDIATYEHSEQVQNGDWNWIVPNKFIAMSGPGATVRIDDMNNVIALGAAEMVPILREQNVRHVIRLNDKEYDRRAFTRVGIQHLELQFPDGSTPCDAILKKFMDYCEAAASGVALAVHCKAGLGRTGTLIACYMMKHYGLTAKECIAWCRMARPGCIIGPQQHYLEKMEGRMMRAGQLLRAEGKLRSLPFDESHVAAPGHPNARRQHVAPKAPPRTAPSTSGSAGAIAAIDRVLARHKRDLTATQTHSLLGTTFSRSSAAPHEPRTARGVSPTMSKGAPGSFFGGRRRTLPSNQAPDAVWTLGKSSRSERDAAGRNISTAAAAAGGQRAIPIKDRGPFAVRLPRPTGASLLSDVVDVESDSGMGAAGSCVALPPL
eukprot:PhM_4_TR10306/c0_g1_i1/m.42824/K06639/CDC14; cell division cycle 14